jgi:hypothetical protein
MKLTRTKKNMKMINDIVKHPDVFSMTWDDHSKHLMASDFGSAFLSIPSIAALMPKVGCLFLLTQNSLTFSELHTMIVPESRGIEAIEAGKNAATWYFKNTTCLKIITLIPEFNRPARIFAKKFGFEDNGNNTKSFLRDGILYDQHIYGLEKEKFLCQQSL